MKINPNKISRCLIKETTLVVMLMTVLYACGSDTEEDKDYNPTTKQVSLVYIQDPYRLLPGYRFTACAKEIGELLKYYGISDPAPYVKNSVSYHRVEYTTLYKGLPIKASGALIIPVKPAIKPSIVCFQHGTMFADRDAPSNANSIAQLFPLFNNYIVFLPDYTGYGSSAGILHPYYICEPTVTCVIDMIKAGKEYLNENHIPYDSTRLFLTGHSEGGYVTLAVQKELETHPEYGITVTASAPSAGPYDVSRAADILLNQASYASPAYIALILEAYNEYYWQEPETNIFSQTYAGLFPLILNGSLDEDEINDRLTTNLPDLLNAAFLNDYRNHGALTFRNALQSNSISGWTPKTPTRLYHGTADDIVPFIISQETWKSFTDAGCDTAAVRLVPLPGTGHDYLPAYDLIVKWFDSFRDTQAADLFQNLNLKEQNSR